MKGKGFVSGALLFFALTSLGAARLCGQAVGEILGTVVDPTGAVIPQARVTALNTATGVSQSTYTGKAGTYTIPNLPVGTYTVTAAASGFKTAVITGITVNVSQQREVSFSLTVGGVQSRVQVQAAPPLLNTTNGTLGGLVTGSQVQTLPLNGRNILNLVQLQPGQVQNTPGSGSGMGIAPSWVSNGNRPYTNTAYLDGIDISDTEFGLIQFWNFNLDAIAQFRVVDNSYPAEYGEGAGSIIQMVSKSGTNQFHGSAFEFVRNSAFDARNFFATSVPPFQRNEFGGTFGGPIKKNKTFFFVEYAGLRQRLGEPTIIPVPTAEERQGLVTITGANGQPDDLAVPLNASSRTILDKYPLPNQPSGIYGTSTYNFMFKKPTNDDQFSARLDQYFSAKDLLFVRASYSNNYDRDTDPVAAIESPSYSAEVYDNPRNYAISETHIFSPTLLNVASFSVNREIQDSGPPSLSVPYDNFTDGTLANFGADSFISLYDLTYFDPQDDLTWIKGRQTLSIGAMYRRIWDNAIGVGAYGPNGVYNFQPGTALSQTIPSTNGGAALLAGTGSPNSLISFMEGDAATYGRSSTISGFGPPSGGLSPFGVRQFHLGTWIQDDVKLRSNLTLNLGLRYEYKSVPYEVGNRLGEPMDSTDYGSGTRYGEFIIGPSPLYRPDYLNFAPRLGLAYRPSRNTVLRGGFGIFTNTIPTMYPDQDAFHFPLAAESEVQNPPFSASILPVPPLLITSTSGVIMPPHGNTKLIPPNTPVNLAPLVPIIGDVSGAYNSTSLRNGYTIDGNITLETQLPRGIATQVSYVANNAVDLYIEQSPNGYTGAEPQYAPFSAITPGLGEFEVFTNGGHSTYNALQAEVRKISHGLQFQATYSWSHLITNADDIFNGNNFSGMSQNNPLCNACEKGNASYDVRQRATLNFDYHLPFDRAFPSGPRRLIGGWQVLGIFSAQSGLPFTVLSPYGTVQFGYDTRRGTVTRPFLIAQPTYNRSGGPQFFSDAVIADAGMNGNYFSVPTTTLADGTVDQTLPGNLGRNTFRAPPFSNFDFSVVKDTKIRESATLQFRAEFFNLFNQHAFSYPIYYLGTPGFGTATATDLPERQIQFGLRLIF